MFKRLLGLESVIQKLSAGQFVSNRTLGRHLNAEEYAVYLGLCQQQRNLRDRLKNKPVEVNAYQLDLKRADFNAIQATAYLDQGDAEKAAVFSKLAKNQNHSILNRLKQQIRLQSELQDWFDRPVLSISEESVTRDTMPRVVTSFSRFKRDDHSFAIINVAKQELKIKAVRDAHQQLSTKLSQIHPISAL